MKKYILPALLLASTILVSEAQTIPTAGTGTGAFSVSVDTPFSSPSSTGIASFNSNFGWANSGADFVFNQMVQFDVAGNEAALNAASSITLELSQIDTLNGVTSASLWLAAQSSVDVTGPDGGASLLSAAALPDVGTLIQGQISLTGTFTFDVTEVLKLLDYTTDKHLYFRLQVDGPTASPGSGLLGFADLTASTLTIVAADVIPTAGSGVGAFRVQINDPFGTPAFLTASANFNSSFGWPNSGANFVFNQMIQFDVTGMEADLNNSSSIILNLNNISNLGGTTSASLWLAAQSTVDVTDQGAGGGNGLLATAALPNTGQFLAEITSAGQFLFDLTWVLKHLDYSTNKQLYLRLQVDAPTTNPGGSPLGAADLTASALEIAVPATVGSGSIGSIKILPSGSNVNLTFKVQQTTALGTVPFADVDGADLTVTENAFGEVDVDVNVGDPAPAKVFFRISAGQ